MTLPATGRPQQHWVGKSLTSELQPRPPSGSGLLLMLALDGDFVVADFVAAQRRLYGHLDSFFHQLARLLVRRTDTHDQRGSKRPLVTIGRVAQLPLRSSLWLDHFPTLHEKNGPDRRRRSGPAWEASRSTAILRHAY